MVFSAEIKQVENLDSSNNMGERTLHRVKVFHLLDLMEDKASECLTR